MAKKQAQAPAQDTGETDAQSAAEEAGHAANGDGATETSDGAADQKVSVAKKITVATVYGPIDVSQLPALQTGTVDAPVPNPYPWKKICRISGYATGTKSGMTQYGPWTAFLGDFAGVNHDTGEITMGKACLIPGAMGDALIESFAELAKESDAPKMRFSVDVFVKRNAREPGKKYDYKVAPVLEAKLSSPAIALLGLS
jgi:hypothetical protein